MSRPVVITGGGTGGHIFPMQAVADALRERGLLSSDVRYIGSRRGQEAEILGGGELTITLLPGRGIQRSFSPRAVVTNIGSVLGLVAAIGQALILIGRWRPRAVLSVGGYASFATSLAAVVWRRPLVLLDLDAVPPATHRVLRRFATRRCLALGEGGTNDVTTGAPVRNELVGLDRSPAARTRAKSQLIPPIDQQRQVVVVMTGSLGALSVNRAVVSLAAHWSERSDLTIVHVTGRRDEDWVRDHAPVVTGLDYRIIGFADMMTWWAVADVAVSRSGATTVAELAVLAIPSILIPLPGAPGDHQTANARALQAVGAAELIRDDDLSVTTLAKAIDDVLAAHRWEQMSQAARTMGRPDAARRIADVVLAVSR